MSLSALSDDALALILEYLDGLVVPRLLAIGNHVLKAKIEQIKKVKIRTWPFMKMPVSLFNLPHLDTLLLNAEEIINVYPFRLNGSLPLPSMPLKSLTKLKMEFAQSFSVLHLVDDVPILDTYFPHLKSLNLANSTVILNEMHIEALPRGLIELELHSIVDPKSAPPIQCALLNNLPSQLEKLRMVTPVISVDETTLDYSSVVWPVGLSHLLLHKVDKCMVYHLPPAIEDLTLRLQPIESTCDPIPTDILPASLTSVRIIPASFEKLTFRAIKFPPKLLLCDLPFNFRAEGHDWTSLPKSLTQMTFHQEFYNAFPLHEYLPNLELMPGISSIFSLTLVLENLPPKLTGLYAYGFSLDQIPEIPRGLKTLVIGIRPVSVVLSRDLRAFIPPACAMSRLPSTLQTLDMQLVSYDGFFSKIDFAFLPGNLRVFNIHLHAIKDVEALAALPQSLRTLSMDVSLDCDLAHNSRLLEYVPSHLKEFKLIMNVEKVAWQDWVDTIANWTELEKLEIIVTEPPTGPFNGIDDHHEHQDGPFNIDYICKLPNSLKSAHFPVLNAVLKPEHMAGLPKGLCSLVLQASSHDPNPLVASDECFANLPASLALLLLPRRTSGITPKLLDLLGAKIVDISGPQCIEELKEKLLQRNWEGFRRFY
jgi:hypothetical protein